MGAMLFDGSRASPAPGPDPGRFFHPGEKVTKTAAGFGFLFLIGLYQVCH